MSSRIDAGEARGVGIAADRIQVAAECCVLREETAADGDGEKNDDRQRHSALHIHQVDKECDEHRWNDDARHGHCGARHGQAVATPRALAANRQPEHRHDGHHRESNS